jgi:hypothetical protein
MQFFVFSKEQQQKYNLSAIGVSCFGPIDLDKRSTNLRLYYLRLQKRAGNISEVTGVIRTGN